MDEIYKILSRHLSGEGSDEDRKLVDEFKSSNKKEYLQLKQLWERRGEINVQDFDTDRAWKNVASAIENRNTRKGKLISLYQTVAIAAMLTAAIFVSYQMFEGLKSESIVTLQTSTVDKLKRVDLADGSVVWLNKGSEISFSKGLVGQSRNLALNGEAYFEVARDEERPFIISTENARVEVLGTSFNINSSTESTKVNVKSGHVRVSSSTSGNDLELFSGESALVSALAIVKESDQTENYLGWKTGIFQFKNIEIAKVVKDLNSFYQNKIILESDTINCNLTARFNNSKLEEIVEVIELSCGVDVQKQGDKFLIR